MKGDTPEGFALIEVLGLVVGVLILVICYIYLGRVMYTKCWQDVTRPFISIEDPLVPGKAIDVSMDPACMEELVITRNTEKCRLACGTYKECSANCYGVGKTFFIAVRKDESSGGSTVVSWITHPLIMARQTYFERSESYNVKCNLDVETIKCTPEEESRYIRIFIEGVYSGACSIRASKESQNLPQLCRVS